MFDVDGTLIDSLPGIVRGLGDAYEKFNGVRPDDSTLRGLVGIPLKVQMRMNSVVPPDDERLASMCSFTIERFEMYAQFDSEFEPAVDALQLAKESGVRTAAVTSKSRRELDFFVDRFSGIRWLDALVCSSEVTNAKPHPDSALLACQKLGVSPSEAAFVGDSIFDIRCAVAAGVMPIGVGYGAASALDLVREGAERVLDTPDDLREWVLNTICQPTCLEKN